MKNNDYLLPGIAAIFVAVLFPVSWIYLLVFSSSSISDLQFGFHLSISSFLFLLVGLTSIYVYYYFIKLLHDHHNFRRADFALWSIIAASSIFYIGSFLMDVVSLWLDVALPITISHWIFGATVIMFGIIDILIGVTLLAGHEDLPAQYKMFAIINLIMGVFEVTLIMSPIVLILLPVVTILIAIIFLKKPEMIEIV
ncbi:MAG: hypothetical protein COB38_10015 [Gammaproteobacteria bacterium]|nr:MAG: hypothetical protein COB38_10015 [Gammaproteobacteria bacterium]